MATSFEKLLDENLSTVIMKQGSLVTGIVIDICKSVGIEINEYE